VGKGELKETILCVGKEYLEENSTVTKPHQTGKSLLVGMVGAWKSTEGRGSCVLTLIFLQQPLVFMLGDKIAG